MNHNITRKAFTFFSFLYCIADTCLSVWVVIANRTQISCLAKGWCCFFSGAPLKSKNKYKYNSEPHNCTLTCSLISTKMGNVDSSYNSGPLEQEISINPQLSSLQLKRHSVKHIPPPRPTCMLTMLNGSGRVVDWVIFILCVFMYWWWDNPISLWSKIKCLQEELMAP